MATPELFTFEVEIGAGSQPSATPHLYTFEVETGKAPQPPGTPHLYTFEIETLVEPFLKGVPGKMFEDGGIEEVSLSFDPFAFTTVESGSATVNANIQEAIALDTTANPITLNLPLGLSEHNGNVILVKLRARPGTNDVTITPSGSDTINGTSSLTLSTEGEAVRLVYTRTLKRWESW